MTFLYTIIPVDSFKSSTRLQEGCTRNSWICSFQSWTSLSYTLRTLSTVLPMVVDVGTKWSLLKRVNTLNRMMLYFTRNKWAGILIYFAFVSIIIGKIVIHLSLRINFKKNNFLNVLNDRILTDHMIVYFQITYRASQNHVPK